MSIKISTEHEVYRGTNDLIEKFYQKTIPLLNCVEPLLKHLDWVGNENIILESLPHYSTTYRLNDHKNVMSILGYDTSEIDTELSLLDEKLYPCLFKAKSGETFVLLEKEAGNVSVYCGDDDTYKTIDANSYAGTVYLFKESRTTNLNEKVGFFREIYLKNRRLIMEVIFISFSLNLLAIITPLFVMSIYDRVIGSHDMAALLPILFGAGIGLTALIVLQTIRSYIIGFIASKLDFIVGNKVFESLIQLPIGKVENATIGAQVARIKDFDTVRDFITSPLLSVLIELPFTLIFLVVIWWIGGYVAAVPFVMVLLIMLLTFLTKPLMHHNVIDCAVANAKRQDYLIEMLGKMHSIKCAGVESVWAERYREIVATSIFNNHKASVISAISSSISDMLLFVSAMAMLTIGVVEISNNMMTVGALIAVMMLMWKILMPLKLAFENLTRIDQVYSSAKQIHALCQLSGELTRNDAVTSNAKIIGDLEFSNVSLRYRSGLSPAVLGLNFKVKPGELVMITGKNGSGKSTIFKLLLRLYTAQAGTIYVDGKDVRQYSIYELRHAAGIVTQTNQFIYGTISQNLRLASPSATMDDLIDATKQAGVYEDILRFPEGFDTRIRDEGRSGMSAGFLEKLSIARAFVKSPSILLFDEPSNYLDQQEDEHFINSICKLRGKKTIMMVTHRPSHLRRADKILVLDNGQLIFQGTPDEVERKFPGGFPL